MYYWIAVTRLYDESPTGNKKQKYDVIVQLILQIIKHHPKQYIDEKNISCEYCIKTALHVINAFLCVRCVIEEKLGLFCSCDTFFLGSLAIPIELMARNRVSHVQ